MAKRSRTGAITKTSDKCSKERLLDAAAALMTKHGYSGASVTMICKEAGVPPTSLYWHFHSKAGLLAAIIERGAAFFFERVREWSETHKESGMASADWREMILRTYSDVPEIFDCMLIVPTARTQLDQDSIGRILGVRRAAIKVWEEMFFIFLEGVPQDSREIASNKLAPLALCMFDGAFIAEHAFDDIDFGQQLDTFIELIDLIKLKYARSS